MSHLANPLATPDQLYRRSNFSALPTDLQDLIFFQSQTLTQAAGLLLQLPQSVTAQANVILARFWLVEPLLSHEFSSLSAAALYLVAKLGPSPASPRNIANVYTYLLSDHSTLFREQQVASTKPPDDAGSYTPSEVEYNRFHTTLLALEARILYALGFDTHVALPHPLAVTYLQALDFFELPNDDGGQVAKKKKSELGALAVRYLNTALLSPQQLYVTHQPPALAVAAVYNAARDVGAKMPECAWWEVFDVEREELGFLVVGMRSLEGWVRRVREDGLVGGLREGMVTRAMVEGEMRRRGLRMGNGEEEEEVMDEEERMARLMDERIAEREAEGIVEDAEDQV
ncbi:Cyclin domain-containing protein [Coniochaeta hoffmannii]|uniref:Cyclin domain-containing protein n=1 Tax=Coniochaeta hoffmannii TaxID=91930 RepID=A0AA38RVG7_9PEZI|nr:Cyclin domain-containing protein [Coniochaeta hoffmannii]